MALTGFDPSVVENSIRGVVSAYNSLYSALNTEMQSKFFQGMSDKWACKQAQDFFEIAKSSVTTLINAVNITFESIANSMNSGARSWASDTGSVYGTIPFSTNSSTIDSSCIQENIGGVRGIDLQNAETTASSSLSAIMSAVDSALTDAKNAVANCGFIGGAQQSNLTASLNTIQSNIHNAVDGLSSDMKVAISNTVSQYGDTEGRVSTAFAGN